MITFKIGHHLQILRAECDDCGGQGIHWDLIVGAPIQVELCGTCRGLGDVIKGVVVPSIWKLFSHRKPFTR